MSKSGGTFTDLKNAQTDANGTPLYGIDKELAEKAASKYDPALEADCRSWLEVVTGTALPEGTLHEALKSGVVLCNAVNAIKPGVCKAPFTGSMAFKQMERLARRDCLREAARETHSPAGPLSPSQENIANFSTACESLGVPKFSLFQTVTLYENKDMGAVLLTLQALGSAAQKVPGYSGPALGAKPSDANVRQFTPEQLAAGKASQTFVGRGSTGTSGSTMGAHVDNSRNINKMQHVVGEMGNLGIDGTISAIGAGSHGTPGSKMGANIDHSKDIDKLAQVAGAEVRASKEVKESS
mmetsp:Transcript_3074/g.10027  ORF Transcript_3074/g.10027 Transcript_3074/m.10027 type:complete len:297 (+) Transcript_3074:42-932(+)